MWNFEAQSRKKIISINNIKIKKQNEISTINLGIRFNLVKCVSIMLVVGGLGEELLKSKFVHGWVNYVLVVDKSALEMKIY